MPNIVTFDVSRLLIIEIGAGSPLGSQDNELDVSEIYSEWKEWSIGAGSPMGGLEFPPAFRVVGGDPITDTQNLGITYFLINGWRIKPAEGNHRLVLVGNIFTDPSGDSISVPTDGSYTVNVENRVSNLVDSSVARLDLAQLLDAVYIDTIDGTAGTGEVGGVSIGTPTLPVSNIDDARIIADRENLRGYVLRGEITLNQSYNDWRFEGRLSRDSSVVNLASQNIDGALFENVTLRGSASVTSEIEVKGCALDGVTNMAGFFSSCGLLSSVGLRSGGDFTLADGFSEVAGNVTPSLNVNGALNIGLRNYSGGILLQGTQNQSPQQRVSIDLDPGHLIIDSSCVGGEILVRGTGRLTQNQGSPSPTVINSGLLEANDLRTARKVLTNKTLTNPSTGIMTILDDDDSTTFLQADLFEDVAGTQPYRGKGADRRDRLI